MNNSNTNTNLNMNANLNIISTPKPGKKKGKHNVLSMEKGNSIYLNLDFLKLCEKQKQKVVSDGKNLIPTTPINTAYSKLDLYIIVESGNIPKYLYEEGPLTRRKENNLNKINENPIENSSLIAYDEFYKNNKNVEHEAYYYKKPRISLEYYQCDKIPLVNNDLKLNEESEKRNDINQDLNFNKIVDCNDEINSNDKNYYYKLVDYLKNEYDSNVFLKGFFNSEQKAIQLLRENNYDIPLCIRKILFPTTFIVKRNHKGTVFTDMGCSSNNQNNIQENGESNNNNSSNINTLNTMNGNTSTINNSNNNNNSNNINAFISKSKTIEDVQEYVNSALHDLIGSNFKEKEEWLNKISTRISEGIDYKELNSLIEIGSKMKIEVPSYVMNEIKESLMKSKLIQGVLNEKNNDIETLEKLLSETSLLKVKSTEYYLLKECINRCNLWKLKANEMLNTSCNIKTIKNCYEEGKNLPVKFKEFDEIKTKYLKAHSWNEKYNSVPKHSKTRQGVISKSSDRTTLSVLKNLTQESIDFNFTSPEIRLLITNFADLLKIENNIQMRFEDVDVGQSMKAFTIGKEELNDYLKTLDQLKFNTSLYDDVYILIDYLEWIDKKKTLFGLNNENVVKLKQLKNLVIDADKKGLHLRFSDVLKLKSDVDIIENWINKLTDIFEDNDKNKYYDIKELKQLSIECESIDFKVEEVLTSLETLNNIFDFIRDCSLALKDESFDKEKLVSLQQKIRIYKINCNEFSMIESQINEMNNWLTDFRKIANLIDIKKGKNIC